MEFEVVIYDNNQTTEILINCLPAIAAKLLLFVVTEVMYTSYIFNKSNIPVVKDWLERFLAPDMPTKRC